MVAGSWATPNFTRRLCPAGSDDRLQRAYVGRGDREAYLGGALARVVQSNGSPLVAPETLPLLCALMTVSGRLPVPVVVAGLWLTVKHDGATGRVVLPAEVAPKWRLHRSGGCVVVRASRACDQLGARERLSTHMA